MDKYIPEIFRSRGGTIYVSMLLEAKECPICKKVMIHKGKRHFNGGHFPNAYTLALDVQMKDVGLVFESSAKVDDHHICAECEQAGKATFLCALCNNRYSTSEIEESFGDPAEFLCKSCYSSVPAQEWDKKRQELYSAHQYDYE